MAARKSVDWGKPNPRYKDITVFDKESLNKDNLVNQILVLKDSDITSSLIMDLFGTFNGSTLVHHYDTFEVPAGAFKYTDQNGKEHSNKNAFTTTFGIWIFNILLFRDLGLSWIVNGYINDNLNKKAFNKIHQKIVYAIMEDKVDTETYKKFITLVDFIMPWETVLSPAQSERLLSCTKEIDKLKAKLIKENKEAIDKGDPATVEKIEIQLLDFAKEYLKDDPCLDPYFSGAGGSFENNFKNMYVMKGVIRDPDPNAKQEYKVATSSFLDGVSSDEYALLANSLAGGPYSRSKKTEIGGYWEKLIVAAMSPEIIDFEEEECGTNKYIETVLTKDLAESFMYSYIIKNNGNLEELTSDNIDKYIGKNVKMRFSIFCKSKTGYCHHCVGNFFYRRSPNNSNIGLSLIQVSSKLKLVSMKQMHDSTVNTVEINPIRAFGLK